MPTNYKKTARHSLHHRVKKHAKLVFFPHAANQFRPHLIRRHGLVAVLVFVIAAQFIGNTSLTQSVLGDKASVTSSELLTLTNDARTQAGLMPLTVNKQLSDAAYLKAQDMFARQYWSHNAPDGTQPWKWLADVQYNYSYAGENLAKNFSSSASVVTAWLDSKTHRENVLKDAYKEVGFAVVDGMIDDKPTSIVVALYGTPASGAVQGAGDVAVASGLSVGPLARLGLSIQTLSPSALGSIAVLIFTAAVAVLAHAYRRMLPVSLRRTWYRHHGAYKAIGLTSLIFVVIALYGASGQI